MSLFMSIGRDLRDCVQVALTMVILMMILSYIFYNGLLNDEVRMVNAAIGGSFLRKTPTAARELLEELVEGSRQFSRRQNPRKTSLDSSSSNTKVHKLEDKVEALTSMMRDFMVKNKTQQVKACGICSLDHATDTCPQL